MARTTPPPSYGGTSPITSDRGGFKCEPIVSANICNSANRSEATLRFSVFSIQFSVFIKLSKLHNILPHFPFILDRVRLVDHRGLLLHGHISEPLRRSRLLGERHCKAHRHFIKIHNNTSLFYLVLVCSTRCLICIYLLTFILPNAKIYNQRYLYFKEWENG